MKKHVIKWGLVSGAFLLSTFMITGLMRDYDNPNYDLGEIIGFSLMFLSMGFIFLGIKAYRDQNSGVVSFIDGLKLGLLITLFPTVAFVAYNFIYVNYLDPEFMDTYYTYQMDKAKETMNQEEYEAFVITTKEEMELFSSDLSQAIVYFFTTYLIGLVVSILSAMIMKRKYRAPELTAT